MQIKSLKGDMNKTPPLGGSFLCKEDSRKKMLPAVF